MYASLFGTMSVTPISLDSSSSSSSTKEQHSSSLHHAQSYTVAVTPQRPLASTQVLSPGRLVLARIVRLNSTQAEALIVVAEGIGGGGGMLTNPPEGMIPREECIRSGTASRDIPDCFQPGDIVLARVLSLGDPRRYVLSTAESELGVIHAICHATGHAMVSCSWNEMQCPQSNVKERRKCAKPRTTTAVLAT